MFARDLLESPLLTAPFAMLATPLLFDVSKDVICELLHSSKNVSRDQAVVQVLIPEVMKLAPIFTQALQNQAQQEA